MSFARLNRLVPILLLVIVLSTACLSADAKWPRKDKEKPPGIENFEPPAEDAYITQCDPIRQKVVNLNDNTPKYLRIFIVPRREYLQHKHRRCKARVMDQQFQYLKHVDIKNPTLPAIPADVSPDVPDTPDPKEQNESSKPGDGEISREMPGKMPSEMKDPEVNSEPEQAK